MSSDNNAITASEFPLALFGVALPLMLAAFQLSNSAAPYNLADMLVTGLAVFGFLAEPFSRKDRPPAPLWLTTGIPALLIVWIAYVRFAPMLMPTAGLFPYLMEARPLLYFIVTALWIKIFDAPAAEDISFWSSWLALFLLAEFCYYLFVEGAVVRPYIFGNYALTGPVLLAGLCATLHTHNKITRLLILAGILCSLNRDISFAAVAILFLFGGEGFLKKAGLIIVLLFFNYISLIPQSMSLLNRSDLPDYWLWFSMSGLLADNPSLLLTGFPVAIPLPLTIPTSLWNIWHDQNFVWTDLGLYLFHLTPFWLHMITAWGLAGIVIVTSVATSFYKKYPSGMLGGLIWAVILAGFFSPLFYSPASAIFLLCAFISCTRPEIQSFKFE